MNEIITKQGAELILSHEVSARIAELERNVKLLKQEQDALKTAVQREMERLGIIKIDTPELLINYIAETDRETLDTKSLKEECPDIYDAYTKMTPVKASLRIKVK